MVTDVFHDLSRQVTLRGENASGNDIALNFGEPDLDLIEPGGIGRSVVDREVWIGFEEFGDSFGFVSREVIGDHMDFFSFRLSGDQLAEKGDKLGAGMVVGRLANDLATAGVQCCIKRECSVAEIFETVTLCPSRGKRQHGVKTIKGLDGGLFVHAEDDCVHWRLEIETDDIGGLGFEVRVIARHVAAQAVGLEPGFCPDAHDSRLTCTESLGQSPSAPLGRSVGRFAMQRPVDDPGLEFLASRRAQLATVPAEESGEPLGGKSISPEYHCINAASLLSADLAQGSILCQSENNSCSATILAPCLSATSHASEFPFFGWIDCEWSCHTNNHTTTVSELNDSLH